MKKKNNIFAAVSGGPLKIWDYIIFAVIAVFCFLVFQQRDLCHTAGCSYGYLNGHIFDFYDYCGQYDIHPSYMPTFYIIFAIWNIPMRLFGVVTFPTEELPLLAVMWAKLLPCIVYIISGHVIYKICLELGMGQEKSRLCTYACLTMPVAFYAQFIFGQYDIIMTICVLLGVYYYIQKRDAYFILWFALAMTFKYTALLIFVPLLLLREKNVWKIFAACILFMIPFAIEILLYRHSQGFLSYTFGFGSAGDNPTGYIMNAGYFTGFQLSALKYNVSLPVLGFGLICGYAYFAKPQSRKEFNELTFYLCCLVFFVLYGLAKWHPQWLLFAVPFWVISAFLHKDTKIFMIIDLIFMVLYVIFNVEMIPGNVDQGMFNLGVLRGVVDGDIGTELMMKDIIGKIDRQMCLSLITMIMLVYAVFKHPKYCAENPAERVSCNGWLRTRFIAGTAFFVIPAFMCLAAYLKSPDPAYMVKTSDKTVVLSQEGDSVSQKFCSQKNSIGKIQFMAGVNGQINKGYLKMTLKDSDGTIMYEKDWPTESWIDGDIITADLNSIPVTEGDYYTVLLEVTQASDDYRLCLYESEKNITGDSKEICQENNKVTGSQLVMTVYQ